MEPEVRCTGEECPRGPVARGMCLKHYKRWKKWGSPEGAAPKISRGDSFRAKTTVSDFPHGRPGLGKCIEWRGLINHAGYGIFTHRPSGVIRQMAHRAALELEGEQIPEGMVVDHVCRNRACVNPAHLEIVTNEENLRRGIGYRLRNGMDNSCVHGHKYTPENTYENPNKAQDIRCRECSRERDRVRSRKKAA